MCIHTFEMKNVICFCTLLVMLVLIIQSEGKYENGKELRQLEDDDDGRSIYFHRRLAKQCEPCGVLRRSCCFPNLCQRGKQLISKCMKTNG